MESHLRLFLEGAVSTSKCSDQSKMAASAPSSDAAPGADRFLSRTVRQQMSNQGASQVWAEAGGVLSKRIRPTFNLLHLLRS